MSVNYLIHRSRTMLTFVYIFTVCCVLLSSPSLYCSASSDVVNDDASAAVHYDRGYRAMFAKTTSEVNLTLAAEELTHAARVSGAADAQFLVGVMHAFGLGGMMLSPSRAVLYETFAAKGGSLPASQALGYRYQEGLGLEKDCLLSTKQYSKVSHEFVLRHNRTVPRASPKLKKIGEHVPVPAHTEAEVLAYYRHSADAGNTESLLTLGYAHMHGMYGLPQNGQRAATYFQQALAKKAYAAYGALGQLFFNGLDSLEGAVEANATLAQEYFVNGSRHHDAVSINGLGFIAMNSEPPMPVRAFNMFERVAGTGNAEGMYNLAVLLLDGAEGVPADPKRAVELLLRASNQRQLLAVDKLAEMHMVGDHVNPSCAVARDLYRVVLQHSEWADMYDEAYKLYEKGEYIPSLVRYLVLSELGYEGAHANAAFLVMNLLASDEIESHLLAGHPDHARHFIAKTLYERESKHGSAAAMVQLGNFYYYGYGTEQSFERARDLYKLAADGQSAEGAFNSAYVHQHGIGVDRDLHLAKRFYDLSVEYDKHATLPVMLALAGLYLQCWFDNPYEWPVLGVPNTAEGQEIYGEQQRKWKEQQKHQQGKASASRKGGSSSASTASSNSSSRLLLRIEKLLVWALVLALVVVLYIRCTMVPFMPMQ
eukprot:PhM_4_TR12210/c0_g1_i1/m.92333/K14026/SEL1, SEL1L; SEL1 protein